jgi:DNA helicase II / ATP-dependent DNA helicase PcrA
MNETKFCTYPDYLNVLNPAQRRAVMHGLKNGVASTPRALLVIAGAGSGKTKMLVHRVTYMIDRGMDPRRLLLLTFSRRAAQEMTNRVKRTASKALDQQQIDLPWSGTFHAIGSRLIREYADRINLHRSFTILDRSDSADLISLVRQDLGLASKEVPFPTKDTCQAIYSLMINSKNPLKTILLGEFPSCARWKNQLRDLFQEYEKAKRRQNVLDYDDLLVRWADLMSVRDVGRHIRSRFDHVLVDEYQDTNRLQAEILFKLRPKGCGLTVVGDDAQAIYSFRGATVRNILDFPDQCEPRARTVTLEQNYRSTQPILEASNKVIGLAKERYSKNLFSERTSKQKPFLTTVMDEDTQARYLAQQIIEAHETGVPLKQQAVLFRASSHSAKLELELARRKIPFVKYGGIKFLETAHIKDVICTLRWFENQNDRIAGARVLQLMPGIGPGTAASILKRTRTNRNLAKTLEAVNVPKPAADAWPRLLRLLHDLRRARNSWPAELQLVREWYHPLLHTIYDDAEFRTPDVAQLEEIAGGYDSRERFLTDLAIDPPDAPKRPSNPTRDGDYVILSTIHSAKGQEYKMVRILNVVDGCIPSSQADDIEEERRLLYVAMTRARNELELVVPQRLFRYQGKFDDQHNYGAISRFIPTSIRDAFEYRRWRDRSELAW